MAWPLMGTAVVMPCSRLSASDLPLVPKSDALCALDCGKVQVVHAAGFMADGSVGRLGAAGRPRSTSCP